MCEISNYLAHLVRSYVKSTKMIRTFLTNLGICFCKIIIIFFFREIKSSMTPQKVPFQFNTMHRLLRWDCWKCVLTSYLLQIQPNQMIPQNSLTKAYKYMHLLIENNVSYVADKLYFYICLNYYYQIIK